MAALMLPRAVLTHLKAGVFRRSRPEPVFDDHVGPHPAPVTAQSMARPSLTTAQAGSSLPSRRPPMEALRKPRRAGAL